MTGDCEKTDRRLPLVQEYPADPEFFARNTMHHIFILNASKRLGNSRGNLNDHLTLIAEQTLVALGYEVRSTRIDDGSDIDTEVANLLWADTVIYQMPAWWMAAPWIMKKYIDDVFTAGHGKLYESDGRSRTDGARRYGSGGLLRDKKYMFSITWNAPHEAFTDPEQFFEGKGIDAVLFPFHKANQFIGMTPLPTFMCNDVVKDPHIADDVARYRKHLQQLFDRH